MGRDDETPFARVPEPTSGPYEAPSVYTPQGEIAFWGRFAGGLRGRSRIVRYGVVGILVAGVVLVPLLVLISN
jgi:hypothetical protein